MKEPIKIHHLDDKQQVRERHERIEARLNELGPDEVRFLQGNGKLPTAWDPIIAVWIRSLSEPKEGDKET